MARGMGHAEAGGYSVVLSRRRSCRGAPPRGSQRVAWEDRADHNPWAATRPPAAGKKRGRATPSGLLQARSHCNSCRGAARQPLGVSPCGLYLRGSQRCEPLEAPRVRFTGSRDPKAPEATYAVTTAALAAA